MPKSHGKIRLYLMMESMIPFLFFTFSSSLAEVADFEFDSLLNELSVAELNLGRAWEKVNESDRYFQFAVNGLAEAEVLDARATGERNRAVRYVEKYKGKVDSARQDFLKLRAAYSAVIGAKLYEELLGDSNQSGIVTDYVDRVVTRLKNQDNSAVEESDDTDILEIFKSFTEKQVETGTAEIERILEDRKLPDFVVQSTRDYAEYSIRFNLYEQYIRLNKPNYLELAEKEVSAIKIRLSKKWPGWHEKVVQGTEE